MSECCCECSPPEFGGNLPDLECPIHREATPHTARNRLASLLDRMLDLELGIWRKVHAAHLAAQRPTPAPTEEA